MTEPTFDEQRADRFFLTDVCDTEAYQEINEELLAKHQRDSSGELPTEFFAELSARLRDLLDRCARMCDAQE